MELKVSISLKGKIFEGKGPEIVQKHLDAAMFAAVAMLEGEVKKRTPTGVMGAQGGLESTIHGEVIQKGTPVIKGVVAHQSKYGDVIEKGRTAGKPMPPGAARFSHLLGEKRGQIGYEGGLVRWIEVKFGVDEKTAARLEFVIRRSIGKKGFPGAHMFEKALNEKWNTLKDIFDREGFEIAKELDE